MHSFFFFFLLLVQVHSTMKVSLFSSRNQETFEQDDLPACSELYLSPYVTLILFLIGVMNFSI